MNDAQKLFWDNRPPAAMQALHDVMAERHRQMMVEGWTAKHDDEHEDGAMAVAAACYALADRQRALEVRTVSLSKLWEWTGWATQWWKPKDKRRNLVRATALLLAEIERIDRAAGCPDHEDAFQHGVSQASRAADVRSASGVDSVDGGQKP